MGVSDVQRAMAEIESLTDVPSCHVLLELPLFRLETWPSPRMYTALLSAGQFLEKSETQPRWLYKELIWSFGAEPV